MKWMLRTVILLCGLGFASGCGCGHQTTQDPNDPGRAVLDESRRLHDRATKEHLIGFDERGLPIYGVDAEGNPVYKRDK